MQSLVKSPPTRSRLKPGTDSPNFQGVKSLRVGDSQIAKVVPLRSGLWAAVGQDWDYEDQVAALEVVSRYLGISPANATWEKALKTGDSGGQSRVAIRRLGVSQREASTAGEISPDGFLTYQEYQVAKSWPSSWDSPAGRMTHLSFSSRRGLEIIYLLSPIELPDGFISRPIQVTEGAFLL